MKKENRSCKNCELNCGGVCGGYAKRTDNGQDTYGSNIKEMMRMFPQGCEQWSISLEAFTTEQENNKLN